MIWHRKFTLSEIQELCSGTLCDHLGMVFTAIGDDFLSATMPVDQRTIQPAGLLHGGASVSLAESLGSLASVMCIPDTTSMPVGVEINANHIKSVKGGLVTGTAKPVKLGQSVHVWNIEIRDEKSDLICVSRLTVMIVKRR